MMITPLQHLLQQRVRPPAEVRQATGRSRYAVRRWRLGLSYPSHEDAAKLIELFHEEQLDFNGCYDATVEVPDA